MNIPAHLLPVQSQPLPVRVIVTVLVLICLALALTAGYYHAAWQASEKKYFMLAEKYATVEAILEQTQVQE